MIQNPQVHVVQGKGYYVKQYSSVLCSKFEGNHVMGFQYICGCKTFNKIY